MENWLFTSNPNGATMVRSVSRPCGTQIPCFKLKQGSQLLTDGDVLALFGLALSKFAKVRQSIDRALPKRSELTSLPMWVCCVPAILFLPPSRTIPMMAFSIRPWS